MQSELGEFHLIVLSWEVLQAHKVLCNLAHLQSSKFGCHYKTHAYNLMGERLHCHIG